MGTLTQKVRLSVSDFVAVINQSLEYAYSDIEVEGEVASFKVNQGKFVFFDLKDESSSVGCFMTVWQLRQPIEDGMKVVVLGTPKLTAWGKFSLTIKDIKPSGEGSLKKSFELLRQKLDKEGLFEAARKRPLPYMPSQIAVISSPQAAGYADFIKILGDRWGGMRVLVAAVQVQGREAPDQIIRALNYFNALEDLPEMVVIIRGGGSADDLSAFNDEPLVRAIASSRVPTVVGVGHETDETLADMVADVRAATPSNAAQLIVPDKRVVIDNLYRELANLARGTVRQIDTQIDVLKSQLSFGIQAISTNFESISRELCYRIEVLDQLNPDLILKRGYAIARGTFAVGEKVEIEKSDMVVITEVKKVNAKN